jgi:SpoVK/Ycf46/Vps4 family AAA+-type ATPase
MVLPEPMAKTFRGILREVEMRERLIEAGIKPRNFIMLEGEPGCGKTMAAGALAAELSLPLVTVQLSTIIGMHMGETSGRLNSIFQEANKLRAVYLFDEFDSLGTKRSSDSGSRDTAQEMARITNGLLQLFDQFDSESLLIASTNRIKDIDPAMRRRFETVVSFALPSRDLVVDLMVRRLGRFGWTAEDLAHQPLDCLSFSYAAMACDDAIRTMVLDGREKLFAADLLVALENIRDRLK